MVTCPLCTSSGDLTQIFPGSLFKYIAGGTDNPRGEGGDYIHAFFFLDHLVIINSITLYSIL